MFLISIVQEQVPKHMLWVDLILIMKYKMACFWLSVLHNNNHNSLNSFKECLDLNHLSNRLKQKNK